MNQKQFLFEKNDCKVYKLTVLNHSYFIVEHAGKRYIRKSSAGVNGLMKSSAYKNHESFDYYVEKYNPKKHDRFIIYTKDLAQDNDIIFIPIYMMMCL